MTTAEIQAQALSRAQGMASFTNYPRIFQGFLAKGIAETDIIPRENVLTFHAWKALGRSVRKGEHGVRIATVVPMSKTDDTGKVQTFSQPRATTVFHISQTDATTTREE